MKGLDKTNMSYAEAMIVARDGKMVRHDDMNLRWHIVWNSDVGYMQQSTLGGSYPYDASERDKAAKWRVR